MDMANIGGTAWKNSKGFPRGNAGYRIKIDRLEDRRKFFPRGTVQLLLEGLARPVSANTNKKSFWTESCGELINVQIGGWMRSVGLIPWGDPPKFDIRPLGSATFEVRVRLATPPSGKPSQK
jgi:hypothetical protein